MSAAEQPAALPRADAGFREAVLSVSDIHSYIEFLSQVASWEVCARGRTDAALLRLWGLDEAVTAEEVLMQAPGSETGFIRLMQFQGAAQRQIRLDDQSWDTGGIFDINVRVPDVERTAAAMRTRNWQGVATPDVFQFGPFTVKEWLARGPDGVRFAFIERIDPPLEGEALTQGFSRLFNSTQIVRDIDQTRRFYTDILGFEIYLETRQANAKPGPSVLGLPYNLSTSIPYRACMLNPQTENEGSVEILSFDGATGADFAQYAVPPNLGMLMLRFPVADAAGLAREVERKGATPAAGPARVELQGYGACELFALRSPEGAWLEFFGQA